jgi:hypothetical protein
VWCGARFEGLDGAPALGVFFFSSGFLFLGLDTTGFVFLVFFFFGVLMLDFVCGFWLSVGVFLNVYFLSVFFGDMLAGVLGCKIRSPLHCLGM